jgi:hypothetical protein
MDTACSIFSFKRGFFMCVYPAFLKYTMIRRKQVNSFRVLSRAVQEKRRNVLSQETVLMKKGIEDEG